MQFPEQLESIGDSEIMMEGRSNNYKTKSNQSGISQFRFRQ